MERFGISPGGQAAQLLQFVGVGILLAVIYDGFRLWRTFTSPPPRRVFWQDLLFFALAAALTQLLALPISRGRVRLFHLLAIALGGAVYLLTVGRLTHRLFRWITAGWDLLSGLLSRFFRIFCIPFCKISEKTQNLLKKVWKNLKNRLHLPHNI